MHTMQYSRLIHAHVMKHKCSKDLFCEIMCRSIGIVSSLAKQKGKKMPQHLMVICDNTVAWGKNQEGLRFLAWLIMKGHFLTATLASLMAGHTHEDIEDPAALMHHIKLWLTKP